MLKEPTHKKGMREGHKALFVFTFSVTGKKAYGCCGDGSQSTV
jgi:hypothetical protein